MYLAADKEHEGAALYATPTGAPSGNVFNWPGRINVYTYGLTKFSELFTNRQLVAMTTFSDLVGEARNKVLEDALAAGLPAAVDSPKAAFTLRGTRTRWQPTLRLS